MTDPADLPHQGPVVDISLAALAANYATVKAASGAGEAAAVVKCDAYGLGMAPVARALYDRAQCRSFFVVYPQEASDLRAALGVRRPARIYCFTGLDDDTAPLLERENITPCLNSLAQAQAWAARNNNAPAAVHIDTGMNRVGAPVGEAAAIAATPGLKVELALSHLACASDPSHPKNRAQRDLFLETAQRFSGAHLSLAASAGALCDRDFAFDMIRPGIALYGGSPFDAADDARLENVVTLKGPIVQLRDLAPGETVGYGATFTAARPTRIAVVALGYGDGFPRLATAGGETVIAGARAPFAGRISMDFATVDVTDLKNPAQTGDMVDFFGPSLRLYEAAAATGRAPYDLLTGLGGRLVRRYL